MVNDIEFYLQLLKDTEGEEGVNCRGKIQCSECKLLQKEVIRDSCRINLNKMVEDYEKAKLIVEKLNEIDNTTIF